MVSARGIARTLQPLSVDAATAIPAQLGVFEIVDRDGRSLWIGQAGGTEPFGLRSALVAAADRFPDSQFRYECTHGYRSRWQELLMAYEAEHGALPPENHDDARLIGRLR